jgi:RNA polymerase sigma-70 factor (ECF subfamily)
VFIFACLNVPVLPSQAKSSDEQLFLRIADHDESAFRDLFRAYAPEISPVIASITGNPSVVLDIVQEVFLRIWLHRHELPGIQTPRAWIFRIAYYQSFNWLRQQKRREKHLSALSPIEPHNPLMAELSFQETKRLVFAAVAQLPPQTRKIYTLSREAGMKTIEIAESLQVSPQTVKNTLSRALASIRTYLAAHDIVLGLLLTALGCAQF